MQTTSQTCSAGIDTHNSTGMTSPFTTVTNKHRTPPRVNGNTLPSTPSSCERLRRVAPSPILVIPRSKIRYSPPSPSRTHRTPPRRPPRPSVAQALSFSLRQQERAPSVCDDGEEDDVNSIVQSYMRYSNSHTDGNQSDGEDDIEIPIILDNGTRASELAIERNIDRNTVLQDVPAEMEDAEFLAVTPSVREEEESMTPGEFYRQHYKPQVMVRFNTNVFGVTNPGEADDEKDNGPLEPESPESHYDDDDETSDRKASTTSSWYVPERRWTDESDYANGDTVRTTVIDEEAEDSDSTPGVFSATTDPLAASPLLDAPLQVEAPAVDETGRTLCDDSTPGVFSSAADPLAGQLLPNAPTHVEAPALDETGKASPEFEDDDSTPGAFSSAADPLAGPLLPDAPTHVEVPALDENEKTSPESFNTELITPPHHDVPLPIPPRGLSDQGFARPREAHDGVHIDRRFLPAKSSFRPSTAPVERPPNVLAPAATTILKRPKLIAPSPRNNTSDGLQLDTTGRRSIDVDHERPIEHAGGTPGRPSRALEDRNTPPVPSLPKHLLKLPPPAMEEGNEEAEPSTPAVKKEEAGPSAPSSEERKKLNLSRLLDELEDPDVEPASDTEDEDDDGLLEELEPKPLPEDLAKVDRSTKLELIVNQDSGLPVWCTLPIRRVSRPEFWQAKEDQALAKAIRWRDPPPKPQPFQQTGAVHFGEPPKKRTQWTFFHSNKSTPTLKGVMINDGTGKDHTRGKIRLNIEDEGVYTACGYNEAGQVEWMFEYMVSKRENAKSRRQRRVRDVYPMNFFAIAAFLDPSRGQVLFPFSKTFQPVYESERMPVARVGRPPVHDSPPEWSLEEVKMARRAGGCGTPPLQGPPTSAVGRIFGAIGIKRSRPTTPASTDKLPRPLASSRPGTASPASRQVDSSGDTPVRSGGLLVGLKHKLVKRPDTSPGIISIAQPSHSAPLALRGRDELQLKRFDTNASGKSVSGKSIKGMISKLGLRPSSRPGSARDGLFPRYDQVSSLEPVQPAGPLGRRRSKSAASALFPARISPSPLGLVREEPVSVHNNELEAESNKSTKTIMGRLRTFSVGARPNSRAKSPLAAESTVAPDATVVEPTTDGTETTKPKGVIGRLRSLSTASRPGSSRAIPAEHPEFDLEELLSAREAAGSALGEHDPVTSLIKHTRAPSGSNRPSLPRSASGTSQISPTPPFVLEELLQARAFGSSDSLAASISSSPILGPAKWKGKGKEIIPEVKAARPGSSKELPVWFSARPNVGSSKSINSLAGVEDPSSSSSSALRPSVPRVQSIVNQVTIVQSQVDRRQSIALKHSSLSIQDIAEYVDGRFSPSTSAITLDDLSSRGSLSDKQDEKPQEQTTFEDAVEMSNRRKGLVPPRPLPQQTATTIVDADQAAPSPEPLARKNTFDRLLKAGETLTMRAINTSVQRIVEENQLVPIEETSGPATESENEVLGTRSRRWKLRARDRPYTPPVSVEAPPMESTVLPRPEGVPNIQSLSPIDPNIRKWNPPATPKSPVPKSPRARPPTTPHGARNKENEPVSKPAPVTPVPPTPTPSLWQRLTRPRSFSNLKAARTTPPPAEITPPLPPLPKSAQKLRTASPLFPQDVGPDPFQSIGPVSRSPAIPSGGLARSALPRPIASSSSVSSMARSGSGTGISSMQNSGPPYLSAKAAGKRPATSSDGPAGPPLPRSTASSSSISSMAQSASTTGIVLMQNTVPPHMRNCHPFAIAIRPIEGRIEGSEWTNLNPQPTHYLVEDPVFKRAMEQHREEARNTTFPLVQRQAGSIPTSTSSSGLTKPPLKPILRKRPSTTQTEQISQEKLDSHLPHHLTPKRWNPREVSPGPLTLSSGPMPPSRGRPSTAQVQR